MYLNLRRPSLVSIYFGLILVLLPVLTLFTLYTGDNGKDHGDSRAFVESFLSRRIVELKEKLSYIEMINQRHMIEVNYLRKVIDKLSSNHSSWSLNSNGLYGNDIQVPKEDLQVESDSVRLPSLLNLLPHLVKTNEPLKLAFRRVSSRYPNGRSGVSLVLGVPTVKRPVQSYLKTTLRNLIDSMNFEERNDVVIVVLIAETDQEYVKNTADQLEAEFGEFIDSGLVEIISPSANYYPDFSSSIKSTLGDPMERVVWRSKQNLDFAFLMMYSQPKAIYYVQLEDDVISKPGYVTKMKRAAVKQSVDRKDWFIIEFCSLGFIGKMIKSVDLPILLIYFIMFYTYQPVDWLLYKIGHVRYCRIDRTEKQCRQAISRHWIQYRPSLFQHIGTHSSLKGKTQKLREKSFGKLSTFNSHADNPAADVTTTIKHYQTYTINAAYVGYSLFWGFSPKAGDYILINFTNPVIIEKYFIRTSNWEHPEDKFYNTSVQVRPLFKQPINLNYNRTNDDFFIVGNFKHSTGIAEGSLTSLGAIKLLRLYCHTSSDKWVLINEILIKAKVS